MHFTLMSRAFQHRNKLIGRSYLHTARTGWTSLGSRELLLHGRECSRQVGRGVHIDVVVPIGPTSGLAGGVQTRVVSRRGACQQKQQGSGHGRYDVLMAPLPTSRRRHRDPRLRGGLSPGGRRRSHVGRRSSAQSSIETGRRPPVPLRQGQHNGGHCPGRSGKEGCSGPIDAPINGSRAGKP